MKKNEKKRKKKKKKKKMAHLKPCCMDTQLLLW